MRNRYPGDCDDCGIHLDAEEGHAHNDDGTWLVRCDDCTAAESPTIRIRLHGGLPLVQPDGFLGGDWFNAYRAACTDAGSRFDRETKGNRCTFDAVPRLIKELKASDFHVSVDPELAERMRAEAVAVRATTTATTDRIVGIQAELAKRGEALYGFQEVGARWLSSRTGALLADEMGLGKQQPVDAKVLTPAGWRPIGKLRVGDQVIGSNGRQTRVTGVFPQGVKPSYRVTFSDRSSVEAGPEHLWTVAYRRGGRTWANMTLTTDELRRRPRKDRLDLEKTELYLPMLSHPVRFSSQGKPPISAYLIGQLIGNGALSDGTPALSSNTLDWESIKQSFSDDGVTVGAVNVYGTVTRSLYPGIVNHIRAMELDVKSRCKRIPRFLFTAAVADRVSLLQGLMDSDGSISESRCKITYHTISKQLASDVRELVECLGGIASVRRYDRSKESKPIEYPVRIRLPANIIPFRVPRKLERYKPGSHASPCRTVTSVDFVRDVESVCIEVAASDSLYVTEHAILTHNTVQALAALPDNAPVLVVCPAIAKGVWRQETARWRPDLTTTTLKGRKSFRWPKAGEIVITNYDILPKDKPDACIAGTVVIADEAHALKNNKALRTKRFRTLAGIARANDGKVWLLTATPLLNRPPELWALLTAADLQRDAFSNWDRFCDMFNGRKGRFGMEWGDHPAPAAAGLLQRVSLRRIRTEVLPDLPTKTYRNLMVNGLDAATRRACGAVLAVVEEAGIDLDDAEKVSEFFRTRGPAFEEMSAARAALATAKIPHLLQVVSEHEEVGELLVVFSAHRSPIDALANREGWAVITGDTSSDDRMQIKDDFQAGKLKGIAGTIQAMGTAVTLTRASQMVFVDLGWTPALNAQAEDRCCRIGQDRGVIVTRLVAQHRLDEMVTATLAAKQEMIDGSIEASKRTEVEDRADALAAAADSAGAETETEEALEARYGARASRRAQRAADAPGNGQGNDRRAADSAQETWAQAALQRLACKGNGESFSCDDGDFGRSLVDQLDSGLTDAQWAAAIRLAKRYWRAVGGPCPEAPIPF